MAADFPLQSFFMAGFECSSHRRADGVRLDLIAATGQDLHALRDYGACSRLGLRSIRDGLRWHLIERVPGTYDWSSWVPMLEAAAEAGVQVMWDLFHYGSPDHIDQGSTAFIDAFASFAYEAARLHRAVTGEAAIFCPINEISYLTWAVRTGYFLPAGPPEPGWFKRQLVCAAIAGMKAARAADPDCRFIWAEPLIHVTVRRGWEEERQEAEDARRSQFEAYDMLAGLAAPELGGAPEFLDIVGVNFYPDNQWYYQGSTIPLGHYGYRPLADMLVEISERYRRPLLVTETGAEGSSRPAWLHYVSAEVREAIGRGADIRGICLYPIAAYPGWDDERLTEVGLFTAPDADGARKIYEPLADEIERQQELFAARGSEASRLEVVGDPGPTQ